MYCLLMGLEAGALGEALPAQRAPIGFLPAVNHSMSDQVALFGEAPTALQTAERLLSRVAPKVFFELTEPHEIFVTVRAAEALLANARPPGGPHPPPQADVTAAGGRRGRVWWMIHASGFSVRQRVSVLML